LGFFFRRLLGVLFYGDDASRWGAFVTRPRARRGEMTITVDEAVSDVVTVDVDTDDLTFVVIGATSFPCGG
jgi:hypothetical protein